ncbi:hypothetical protein [Bacteroides sp. 519]|uniref:hypothetical protein n=1 Tax=Bacteroides sp. 519 TaxID=2302937 RepID=UPI0013D32A27|nr:hypothetical protein [Bacteroides sp. 519]NDV58070.1 hypothetical protein [Bacteroides sp. 519]
MSINNDAILMRIAERNRAFNQFREVYIRMDKVIEALYQSGLYTVEEFAELALEYRVLKIRAEHLEEYIRRNFPAKNLDETIKWMKNGRVS